LGQQNIIGNISLDMTRETFDEMHEQLSVAFDNSDLGLMFGVMQRFFGPEKYNLWHLFKDEKRKVLKQIMDRSLNQVEGSFRRIYNRDYQLINTLHSDEIPIPTAYVTTLQYVLNADLSNALDMKYIDLQKLEAIKDEFDKWGVKLDNTPLLEKRASVTVLKALERIANEKGDVTRIHRLNALFSILEDFGLNPSLYKSQNLYFEISINQKDCGVDNAEWYKAFEELGGHLGVKVY
ncbi:MAG: glycoside hydrolase, partial [Bacteroidota bacterium]